MHSTRWRWLFLLSFYFLFKPSMLITNLSFKKTWRHVYELVCVCVCVCVCVICKSMCMCVHMCIIVCEWKMLCVLCVYGCVSIFFGPEIHPKYAVAPLHSTQPGGIFFFFNILSYQPPPMNICKENLCFLRYC